MWLLALVFFSLYFGLQFPILGLRLIELNDWPSIESVHGFFDSLWPLVAELNEIV